MCVNLIKLILSLINNNEWGWWGGRPSVLLYNNRLRELLVPRDSKVAVVLLQGYNVWLGVGAANVLSERVFLAR